MDTDYVQLNLKNSKSSEQIDLIVHPTEAVVRLSSGFILFSYILWLQTISNAQPQRRTVKCIFLIWTISSFDSIEFQKKHLWSKVLCANFFFGRSISHDLNWYFVNIFFSAIYSVQFSHHNCSFNHCMPQTNEMEILLCNLLIIKSNRSNAIFAYLSLCRYFVQKRNYHVALHIFFSKTCWYNEWMNSVWPITQMNNIVLIVVEWKKKCKQWSFHIDMVRW